jgi:stage II sporulation protein R
MRRKAAFAILTSAVLAGLIVVSAWGLPARELAGKACSQDLRAGGAFSLEQSFKPANLIRLHIIANSNDPGDQELKYRVRDAIIAAFRPELLKLHSRTEAEALLSSDRGKITSIAEQVMASNGRQYPARVEIGDFDFPTRTYGDLVLPAGNYRAVRVILGQGAGANWWCVLFPPLCFVDVSGAGITTGDAVKDPGAALTNGSALPPEADPVAGGGGIKLRLRVLDWLESESGYMARVLGS